MMLIQGILCINSSTNNNNREVNKQKTAAAVL